MSDASRDTTKRKRPVGKGTPVMLRLQPEQLAAVDGWREAQNDDVTRPEAVRRLVARSLSVPDGQ